MCTTVSSLARQAAWYRHYGQIYRVNGQYMEEKVKLHTFLISEMDGNKPNYSPQGSVPVLNRQEAG
jgi:hypothetical protein